MRIRATSTLGDLESDLTTIAQRAPREMQGIVRDGAKAGNMLAKDFARKSSGSHGKLYPRSFTATTNSPFHGFGASVYSSEYGPDAAKPQGNMEFERGSRNQPPHNDLAKSADVVGPILGQEVRQMLDRLFWPAS